MNERVRNRSSASWPRISGSTSAMDTNDERHDRTEQLPSADAEHENRAAGDAAMELDLDEEADPSPAERAAGAEGVRLDP